MFFCTLRNLAKPGSKTLEHRGRLLGPSPKARYYIGRRSCYKARFLDTGPGWSRVWLAVKPGTRHRRHPKPKNHVGERLLWRPIQRGYQRLYEKDIMRNHVNKWVPEKRLRAANTEIGRVRHAADGYHFKGHERFGPGPYYPLGYNGEYRMF